MKKVFLLINFMFFLLSVNAQIIKNGSFTATSDGLISANVAPPWINGCVSNGLSPTLFNDPSILSDGNNQYLSLLGKNYPSVNDFNYETVEQKIQPLVAGRYEFSCNANVRLANIHLYEMQLKITLKNYAGCAQGLSTEKHLSKTIGVGAEGNSNWKYRTAIFCIPEELGNTFTYIEITTIPYNYESNHHSYMNIDNVDLSLAPVNLPMKYEYKINYKTGKVKVRGIAPLPSDFTEMYILENETGSIKEEFASWGKRPDVDGWYEFSTELVCGESYAIKRGAWADCADWREYTYDELTRQPPSEPSAFSYKIDCSKRVRVKPKKPLVNMDDMYVLIDQKSGKDVASIAWWNSSPDNDGWYTIPGTIFLNNNYYIKRGVWGPCTNWYEYRIYNVKSLGCKTYDNLYNSIENDEVYIYPNPASSFINIRTAAVIKEVLIYNNAGTLVLKKKASSFSIEELESGIYFMSIKTEDKNYYNKFTKN